MLQMGCLSSENLKEENDALSISDTTLISRPPHNCFARLSHLGLNPRLTGRDDHPILAADEQIS